MVTENWLSRISDCFDQIRHSNEEYITRYRLEPIYRAIQIDGLNWRVNSLFAQIGDSNDKLSSSLEVECWNEDETHAAQQSPTQF